MRKIIHIDADAFYASVEERDNPALKNQAVAVGGNPNRRGVVATCNYIARQYGVHSAMPSSVALRLCPQLVFIRPRFEAYREASQAMHKVFRQYTDLIEPLSLDEAYLDVSQSKEFHSSATLIAQAIQNDIKSAVNLSVSAGVAPNKFLAKIASDWNKPAGLFVITPDQVDRFVAALPVTKINGVGKVTAQKLKDMNIETCTDIRNYDSNKIIERFGKYGKRLLELANGVDNRPVVTERQRKSLSVETTFSSDISSLQELTPAFQKQFEQLAERVNKANPNLILGRYIKLKFNDFTQTTMDEAIHAGIGDWKSADSFINMIEKAWERKHLPIRLLGMGVRIGNNKNDKHQLDLFD